MNKGFANIILILVVVVFVGGAAGYFYWSKKMAPAEQIQTTDTSPQQTLPSSNDISSQTSKPPSKPISNTSPTPAPATGEPANWKNYRNRRTGLR